MKCINKGCSNELIGRQKTYCSDKCRMHQTRTGTATKPEQIKVEQAKSNTLSPESVNGKYNREYLPGGKLYVGCCKQDKDGNWLVQRG